MVCWSLALSCHASKLMVSWMPSSGHLTSPLYINEGGMPCSLKSCRKAFTRENYQRQPKYELCDPFSSPLHFGEVLMARLGWGHLNINMTKRGSLAHFPRNKKMLLDYLTTIRDYVCFWSSFSAEEKKRLLHKYFFSPSTSSVSLYRSDVLLWISLKGGAWIKMLILMGQDRMHSKWRV